MGRDRAAFSVGTCWSPDQRLSDLAPDGPAAPGVPAVAKGVEEPTGPVPSPSILRFSPEADPPTRPPALRPPDGWLSRFGGDGTQRFPFRAGGLTLGRSVTCGVTLEESSLGWQEAEITWDGEDFHLQGLGRAQSFLVNGHVPGDTILRHGDLVEFAGTRLQWCCPASPRSTRSLGPQAVQVALAEWASELPGTQD